jgi:hypothetical protein
MPNRKVEVLGRIGKSRAAKAPKHAEEFDDTEPATSPDAVLFYFSIAILFPALSTSDARLRPGGGHDARGCVADTRVDSPVLAWRLLHRIELLHIVWHHDTGHGALDLGDPQRTIDRLPASSPTRRTRRICRRWCWWATAANLSNASVMQDPDGGERTQAQVLRIDDQGVTSFETSAEDLGLMRNLPALPADLTPRRLMNPSDNTREDPAAAATAQARRRAHALPEDAGRCGRHAYSGDYLISKVVHHITPSLYTQELEAKTDSATEISGAAVAEALGGGLQLSVSASAGIF